MMTYDDFIGQLKRHEGYAGRIYVDSVGVLTGGWGHAFIEGSKISVDVASKLLYHDIMQVTKYYETLKLPIERGDDVREFVIKNMLFNLGLTKLLGFKRMLAAVRAGNYNTAAIEMLDSRWARQVKGRAMELAEMMKTGKYTDSQTAKCGTASTKT